jgi:hypothetical protein
VLNMSAHVFKDTLGILPVRNDGRPTSCAVTDLTIWIHVIGWPFVTHKAGHP